MKLKLLLLFYLCPVFALADGTYMSKEEAESFVKNGLYKKIEKTVNEDKANKLFEDDWASMYGRDNNGRLLYNACEYPNDLYILNGNKGNVKSTPKLFIGGIAEYARQHNVHFSFEVLGSDYHTGPELKKRCSFFSLFSRRKRDPALMDDEDKPSFADVYVRKEWVVDGITTVIYDTVSVNLKQRNVPQIRNGVVLLQDLPEIELEGMLAKATLLYDKEYYYEAFALYRKILNEYPDNDEAWYNMGVMYFNKQGVGDISRKQRLQKAYDCWKNSNLKKACRAISYITDGREGC